MATTPKTIMLLCKEGDQREARLDSGAVITPGMLLEVTVANVATPSTSDTNMVRIAIEMAMNGKGIGDNYTISGDTVPYIVPNRGDHFYGLLKVGSNAIAGSLLANDGAGGLVVTTDAQYALGKALEAVDNSAGSAYKRVRVEITGDTMPATTAAVPVITVQPADDSILSGATAALSVTATGQGTLHYQWYEGLAGITTTPVGTDSNSYTTAALTADKDYWVRVYNLYGSVDSDVAHITVT